MLIVVRLAENLYSAYCLETGFLALGSMVMVARALAALGLKWTRIHSLFHKLDARAYFAQDFDIPLLLGRVVRLKQRSRQV